MFLFLPYFVCLCLFLYPGLTLQPNCTQNTHYSILTVHKVSTSVVNSGCQQIGELLLVAVLIVNINSPGDGHTSTTSTSKHQYVLQLDGTSSSKKLDTFLGVVFDPPGLGLGGCYVI